MRAKHGTFEVIVERIEQLTPTIRSFRLSDPSGDALPGFSGGSHITVLIKDGQLTYRNPYSLISSPFDTRFYEIAVALNTNGRGGSRALHHAVKEGARIEITFPANQFPLDRLAKKQVLIAGGVGITPMLAYLKELEVDTTPYEMHYGVRNASEAGLGNRIGEEARDRVSVYHEDHDGRMDFTSILSDQPLGSHVYICGPKEMLESVLRSARACGWPDSHIHFELFDQQTTGQPFEVLLARSGITLSIPPELSLLEAAEAAGVAIPYLCRGGACGQCETEILELNGELIHRDIWLSDADKQAGKKMMPCVSRANCTKLSLNA